MAFGFIRVLFVLLSMVLGFQFGTAFQGFGTYWGIIGAGVGTTVSLAIILLEHGMGRVSLRGLSAAVFGLILALIVAKFLNGVIDLIPDLGEFERTVLITIGARHDFSPR